MHDPSFMASALIVPEKRTYSKNLTKVSEPLKVGQQSKLNEALTLTLQDVCSMHDPSFMALALIVSEKMT